VTAAPAIEAGQEAPDFTLRDQHGTPTSLRDFRGKQAVVLVFFPFAFSGVCTGELRDLAVHAERFRQAGAALLGLSCDPMFALRAHADRDGIEFPLLSDFWPHGEVAGRYGVLDTDKGCPTRSTFVVDRAGLVRWQVHNPMGEARDLDAYLREVEAAQTTGADRTAPK
jgi:peroxiredoxin